MYRITLEWLEGQRIRTRTISSDDHTLIPHSIRIGRGDETECDIILKHPNPHIEKTVSKVHVELFFDSQKSSFFLRNLTGNRPVPNPVIVNGKKIITEIIGIETGTKITLGNISLIVKVLKIERNLSQYIVKCSGPKQHTLEAKYEGLNCPYCGYIVFTGTILKF